MITCTGSLQQRVACGGDPPAGRTNPSGTADHVPSVRLDGVSADGGKCVDLPPDLNALVVDRATAAVLAVLEQRATGGVQTCDVLPEVDDQRRIVEQQRSCSATVARSDFIGYFNEPVTTMGVASGPSKPRV